MVGGINMVLLAFVGGFLFGAWLVAQWGNHRAKYYKRQMKKSLMLCEKIQESNKLVAAQLEEYKNIERERSTDKMRVGLMNALADMSMEGFE